MSLSKSPFLILPEFVSPLMAEEIVDQLDFLVPDTNRSGKPLSSVKSNDEYEEVLYSELMQVKSSIERHFCVEHQATSQTMFEWYPAGSQGKIHAENSEYLHKKWVRVRDRDLTGVVFLSDYNDRADFDDQYEVYGGKLEFPQHGFGFNPQRGTLVIFPSVPHFINTITPIQAGSLHIARFHIKTKVPFLYDPSLFPGDFKSWFTDVV